LIHLILTAVGIEMNFNVQMDTTAAAEILFYSNHEFLLLIHGFDWALTGL